MQDSSRGLGLCLFPLPCPCQPPLLTLVVPTLAQLEPVGGSPQGMLGKGPVTPAG